MTILLREKGTAWVAEKLHEELITDDMREMFKDDPASLSVTEIMVSLKTISILMAMAYCKGVEDCDNANN